MARDRTDLSKPPHECGQKIRGIETVRRDGVVFSREVMQQMVDQLCNGGVGEAISTLRQATDDLLQ